MKFNTATFLTSALEEFPQLKMPEMAIVGRSNVGKSSLINVLFGKKIAKTSSTPGKTQRINFFRIDEEALLVDLPGYGYSKAPKAEVDTWSQAIDAYLNNRKQLQLILLLIDSRREIALDDQKIMDWAKAKEIPLLVIRTKADKIKTSLPNSFSTKNPKARELLIHWINQLWV